MRDHRSLVAWQVARALVSQVMAIPRERPYQYNWISPKATPVNRLGRSGTILRLRMVPRSRQPSCWISAWRRTSYRNPSSSRLASNAPERRPSSWGWGSGTVPRS